MLALAIVLGGFALVARNRTFAGALIVALSALVKAPGAIAALLWLRCSRLPRKSSVRRRCCS
jgi:hypothetical protein